MKHNPEQLEKIKTAWERNEQAVTLRPGVGQKTAVMRVRVLEGVHCEAEEGRWKIIADSGEKSGGTGKGPDPSCLVRSALGTCFAMGYVIWAARLGVPISNVEVEVQADFDARGQHGIGDIPAGFTEIRYEVKIESTASEEDIQRVLDRADRNSVVGDVFRRPHTLVRQLTITRPGG